MTRRNFFTLENWSKDADSTTVTPIEDGTEAGRLYMTFNFDLKEHYSCFS